MQRTGNVYRITETPSDFEISSRVSKLTNVLEREGWNLSGEGELRRVFRDRKNEGYVVVDHRLRQAYIITTHSSELERFLSEYRL